MNTLPSSVAKSQQSRIADDVDRTHERVHITRNGKEFVVLLSAQDLESLEATIELLTDHDATRRIREAELDIAAGTFTTAPEMTALMDERRDQLAS
jgi:antitoxin YefM